MYTYIPVHMASPCRSETSEVASDAALSRVSLSLTPKEEEEKKGVFEALQPHQGKKLSDLVRTARINVMLIIQKMEKDTWNYKS